MLQSVHQGDICHRRGGKVEPPGEAGDNAEYWEVDECSDGIGGGGGSLAAVTVV